MNITLLHKQDVVKGDPDAEGNRARALLEGVPGALRATPNALNLVPYVAELRGYVRLRLDGKLFDRGGKLTGQAIEDAFSSGRANVGTAVQADAASLGGPGPMAKNKLGEFLGIPRYDKLKMWFQDRIDIHGVGPNGRTAELRTHSAHPIEPPGSSSSKNYTTQIDVRRRQYWSPERQKWVKFKDLNDAERSALHLDARN